YPMLPSAWRTYNQPGVLLSCNSSTTPCCVENTTGACESGFLRMSATAAVTMTVRLSDSAVRSTQARSPFGSRTLTHVPSVEMISTGRSRLTTYSLLPRVEGESYRTV